MMSNDRQQCEVESTVCIEHAPLVERVDRIAKVLGVPDNPLDIDSSVYANTVIGMLVKQRRDWKTVKAVGVGIIAALLLSAVYIESHSDRQVREMAAQVLALKNLIVSSDVKSLQK
jgi:hypothetical protein